MRWQAALLLAAIPSSLAATTQSLIFNDDEGGEALLWLCSRESPQPYDGRWLASERDVAFAEEQLLHHHTEVLRNAGIDKKAFREDYSRAYAGFTRNGERFLYASYGPTSAIGICDGGPAYFGVEFRMPSGEVTHISYNGMA